MCCASRSPARHAKVGALLSRQAFNEFRTRLIIASTRRSSGRARVCIIGHGSSNDRAIYNASACYEWPGGVIQSIEAEFAVRPKSNGPSGEPKRPPNRNSFNVALVSRPAVARASSPAPVWE